MSFSLLLLLFYPADSLGKFAEINFAIDIITLVNISVFILAQRTKQIAAINWSSAYSAYTSSHCFPPYNWQLLLLNSFSFRISSPPSQGRSQFLLYHIFPWLVKFFLLLSKASLSATLANQRQCSLHINNQQSSP